MELHAEHLQLLLTLTDEAAPLWQTIGLELGFTYSEISWIASKPLRTPEGTLGYYQEMIAQWLLWGTLSHPLPTVEALTSALRKAGREQLALQIESEKDGFPPSKVNKLTCGDCKYTSESPPSTTPPVPLPLPTPLERSQPGTVEPFDMISALQGAGVPHITQQILCYLDSKSLLMSELVSTLWRDVIGELSVWKLLVKQDLKNNPLWRSLFERREWHKYLEVPLSKQMPSHFYQHLHLSACRDIQSLEANWRRGHYTFTRVETGSWVSCLQYDDNKIVTGLENSTIKIWDKSTLKVLKVLEGHKSAVRCLQYNEEVVISSSEDLTVKVWDIQTGQVVNDLLHHRDIVHSLKFTPDTLVTGSYDQTVRVWNIKSPTDITLKMTLNRHEDMVVAVDISETTIVSGCADGTIKVWDSSTGELVRTLHGHSDWVSLCLQLQGNHLICGLEDYTLRFTELVNTTIIRDKGCLHCEQLQSFIAAEHGRLWNIDTGACTHVLHGHTRSVNCIAVDNKRILSGSVDSTIKVWDLAAALDAGSSSDSLCITTLKEHTNQVYGLQFDDFQVISGAWDGTLVIRNFLDLTPPSCEL